MPRSPRAARWGLALALPALVAASTAWTTSVAGASPGAAGSGSGSGSGPAGAGPAGPPAARPGRGADDPRLSYRLGLLASPALAGASGAAVGRALGLPPTGPGSLLRAAGGAAVAEVRVSDPARVDAVAAAVAAAGARVTGVSAAYATVSAAVPVDALAAVAAVPGVDYVREVLTPRTSGAAASGATAAAGTRAARTSPPEAAATGCRGIVSEGDGQLRAADARDSHGVDGAGVPVGVLSDSFDTRTAPVTTAAQDVVNGDLPGAANTCGYTTPVQVLEDHAGGTDEGRAMAQIVHDLAPGSPLLFATAFNGLVDFATNIGDLVAAGAAVVTDDVYYFEEPVYQDGPVANAIAAATAAGVAYTTSAGNGHTVFNGDPVGSYETAAFRPGTCPAAVAAFEGSPAGLTCHDFTGTGDVTAGYGIVASDMSVNLQWAEPWDGVATDLDLFLVNAATGAVISQSSATNPTVTGRPFEFAGVTGTGGLAVVVARYSGSASPRFRFTLDQGVDLSSVEHPTPVAAGDVMGPTVVGHSGTAAGLSVAATAFDDGEGPEGYSSQGPFTAYFGPVSGTTPADPLPAPDVRAKPDLTATDGGANSFFGRNDAGTWRFYGTSAAAPHAAAVAALALQAAPGTSPAVLHQAMRTTAASMAAGVPDRTGAGRVDAVALLDGLAGSPTPTETSPSPTETSPTPTETSPSPTETSPSPVRPTPTFVPEPRPTRTATPTTPVGPPVSTTATPTSTSPGPTTPGPTTPGPTASPTSTGGPAQVVVVSAPRGPLTEGAWAAVTARASGGEGLRAAALAGRTAYLTVDGVARASATVAGDGGIALRVRAAAGRWAVRVGVGAGAVYSATFAPAVKSFRITGHSFLPGGIRVTATTGAFPRGTVLVLTRDGRAAAYATVAGPTLTFAAMAGPGRWAVRQGTGAAAVYAGGAFTV